MRGLWRLRRWTLSRWNEQDGEATMGVSLVSGVVQAFD